MPTPAIARPHAHLLLPDRAPDREGTRGRCPTNVGARLGEEDG